MKNNKVLLIILLSVLSIVVGYALFSDNVTINGTASADGTFEVSQVCTKGIPSNILNLSSSMDSLIDPPNGYSDDACVVSGTTVSFQTNLNYPTAQRTFTVKFTNTGTIPAILMINSGNDISISSNLCLFDKTTNNQMDCYDISKNNGTYSGDYSDFNYLALEDSNGKIFLTNEDYGDEILDFIYDEEGNSILLKPGNSIYVYFTLKWPGYINPTNTYFKYNLTSSFTFRQISAE